MELSKADLQIIGELNKKIEYYTKRILECKEEIRYFYNKGDSYR